MVMTFPIIIHHPTVDHRQALRREPEGERLEAGHEAGGHAESDERAAGEQRAEILRDGERRRDSRPERSR